MKWVGYIAHPALAPLDKWAEIPSHPPLDKKEDWEIESLRPQTACQVCHNTCCCGKSKASHHVRSDKNKRAFTPSPVKFVVSMLWQLVHLITVYLHVVAGRVEGWSWCRDQQFKGHPCMHTLLAIKWDSFRAIASNQVWQFKAQSWRNGTHHEFCHHSCITGINASHCK